MQYVKSLSISESIALGTFALLALEMALMRAQLVPGHFAWRDTLASIAMRAGNYASNLLLAGAVVAVFAYLHQHRLFDISPASPWAWAALVVLDDVAYYVFHRASHECRFWWAAHVNHHSSQEYNLSTAIRQTWTGGWCAPGLRGSRWRSWDFRPG